MVKEVAEVEGIKVYVGLGIGSIEHIARPPDGSEIPEVPFFDLIDEDGKYFKTIAFESFYVSSGSVNGLAKKDSTWYSDTGCKHSNELEDYVFGHISEKCKEYKRPIMLWREDGICNIQPVSKKGKIDPCRSVPWYHAGLYVRFAIIEYDEIPAYGRWLIDYENNYSDENKVKAKTL